MLSRHRTAQLEPHTPQTKRRPGTQDMSDARWIPISNYGRISVIRGVMTCTGTRVINRQHAWPQVRFINRTLCAAVDDGDDGLWGPTHRP